MKKEKGVAKILKMLREFLIFFCVVAFVITCCLMLFVSTLAATLNITLTTENLTAAGRITFLNVVLLSVILTVGDLIRKKLTVSRSIKHITEASEKLMQGDFSVRIKPVSGLRSEERFNEIIDCFNKMAEELGSIETLRLDFIANVSHEMKTPLAVMQNYSTLLQLPNLSEEKRIEYAKGISDGSRRMADMMANILKLNRLENQQIYPKAEEFDLGEQLCSCLIQYENVWEKENIEIVTDIAEDVIVRADAELLSLVWNNLFSNAFKFTESGGTVSVSLTATEHHAVVKVSDTGSGMSPEVGARIFEKFYQADSSRSARGNGLGLALVKRVVDILHGEIGVESVEGKGSTFTVRIRRF